MDRHRNSDSVYAAEKKKALGKMEVQHGEIGAITIEIFFDEPVEGCEHEQFGDIRDEQASGKRILRHKHECTFEQWIQREESGHVQLVVTKACDMRVVGGIPIVPLFPQRGNW